MLLTLGASTRVAVTVTFLRLDRVAEAPPSALPASARLTQVDACSVPFYRYLYGTVGGPYVWWLRRSLDDRTLADLLAEPAVSVHVLYAGGEPAGFFELDRRSLPTVNLSYFGLVPHATGQRMGRAFLHAAIVTARGMGARAITVNTCTADHPRALPGYLAAGFQPTRTVREVWDVPNRLGMVIPEHLRA